MPSSGQTPAASSSSVGLAVTTAASSSGTITRSKTRTLRFSSDEHVGNLCKQPSEVDIGGKTLKFDDYVTTVDELMDERRELQKNRTQLMRDLRNAQRRRQRLKRKAKELNNSDLVAVLMMRDAEEKRKKTKSMAAAQDPKKATKNPEHDESNGDGDVVQHEDVPIENNELDGSGDLPDE